MSTAAPRMSSRLIMSSMIVDASNLATIWTSVPVTGEWYPKSWDQDLNARLNTLMVCGKGFGR